MVIGFGSIGARHARILTEIGCDVAVASRRSTIGWNTAFRDVESAIVAFRPDYVVIATETSAHRDALHRLTHLGFTGLVLVEKPLVEMPGELPVHAFAGAFVGYNLRFHPAIRRLRDSLSNQKALSAEVYVGSWLPDWRPGRDYRSTASASNCHGGGALRDLSHELDYLLWLFGPWMRVAALGGKLSELEVAADDAFALLVELEHCPLATVQLNYLDRKGRRRIVVNGTSGTYGCDLIEGTFWDGAQISTIPSDRDATYSAQHRAVLAGDWSHLCSFDEGLATMALIAAAEHSAERKQWQPNRAILQ